MEDVKNEEVKNEEGEKDEEENCEMENQEDEETEEEDALLLNLQSQRLSFLYNKARKKVLNILENGCAVEHEYFLGQF